METRLETGPAMGQEQLKFNLHCVGNQGSNSFIIWTKADVLIVSALLFGNMKSHCLVQPMSFWHLCSLTTLCLGTILQRSYLQRIPEGDNKLSLQWCNEALECCIVRNISGNMITEDPLTNESFSSLFRQAANNACYFIAPTIHAMCCLLGKEINSRLSLRRSSWAEYPGLAACGQVSQPQCEPTIWKQGS